MPGTVWLEVAHPRKGTALSDIVTALNAIEQRLVEVAEAITNRPIVGDLDCSSMFDAADMDEGRGQPERYPVAKVDDLKAAGINSVAIDRNGRPWQFTDNEVWADAYGNEDTGASLIQYFGPIALVYITA